MPDVDKILKGAQDNLTVKRVYGDPIERDGVTVIPAALVGGGGGGGGDSEQNGGAGFGLVARPIGAYVIRGDQVRWVPAVGLSRIALYGLIALLIVRSILRRR